MIKGARYLSAAILFFSIVVGAADAQVSGRQMKSIESADFEICDSGYLDYDNRKSGDGGRVLFLSIFVTRKPTNESKIRAYAEKLKATFSAEKQLSVLFFIDRAVAKGFFREEGSQNEAKQLKTIHGIFAVRPAPQKEVFRFYPRGTTAADWETLD